MLSWCICVPMWMSVHFRDRQLAESEHWDAGEVSSLCHVWPGRGEIVQLPRTVLQLCWCGWGLCSHRRDHCWGHIRWDLIWFTLFSFQQSFVNDIFLFPPQIYPVPQAILWPSGTQAHQSLSPGEPQRMSNAWSAITLNAARWAPTSGCRATTNPSSRPGGQGSL